MASSQEHAEIRAALERYSKDELVDLMEHLLRLYVLNEPVKLESTLKKPDTLNDLTGYSFAQVISTLKTTLELDELAQFRVTPFTTYVNIGGQELDMNGPAPAAVAAPAAADTTAARSDADEDDLSPAERMDLDAKPWRSAPAAPAPAPTSHAETPSMAELFADDSKHDRGYIMFDEPPTAAEEDDELPPPIADVAPGDDPQVAPEENNFAKAAASRDEPEAPKAPEKAPALAPGDSQIDPSNRFASLDLD